MADVKSRKRLRAWRIFDACLDRMTSFGSFALVANLWFHFGLLAKLCFLVSASGKGPIENAEVTEGIWQTYGSEMAKLSFK